MTLLLYGPVPESPDPGLPAAVVEESRRFGMPRRRREFLAGRRLLMIGLERLGASCALSDLVMAAGKPGFEGGPWFSISHSRGMAACALSDAGDIGLDIEARRHMDPESFRPWFTPGEMEEVRASGDPPRELLRRWTAAEALYKACGEEKGEPVGSPAERGGYHRVKAAGREWHVYPIRLTEGFEATLVSSREEPGVSPEYIPCEYQQGRCRFP